MKKRHMLLMVGGLSLVGFASPNLMLGYLKHKAGEEEKRPVASLVEREARYTAGLGKSSGRDKINYLDQTKSAITRELQEKGKDKFKVSNIVFTSEKSKLDFWVAGQKQVYLSFTYQVQYDKGKPKKLKGSILLASDETGQMTNSDIKI